MRWTLYFVKQVSPAVSKAAVQTVVRVHEMCQSINPVHWKVGKLDVQDNWRRVGMDITHYENQHYLTLIDFSIWHPLQHQNATRIVCQLESVFSERGPPAELLTDNGTAFSGKEFRRFAENWGIQLRFWCAYVPSGNGIVERCHRTIKRIAARTHCFIMEALYWYNVMPKDDAMASTAPANAIYNYHVRVKGMDTPPLLEHVNSGTEPSDSSTELEEAELDNDDAENERGPLNTVMEEVCESCPILCRSSRQRRPPSPCHLCDHEIREECRKEMDLPLEKRAHVYLACKGKNGCSNILF